MMGHKRFKKSNKSNALATTAAKDVKWSSTPSTWKRKDCHKDPSAPVKEYPNLFLGSEKAVHEDSYMFDYIVCLSSADGSIWWDDKEHKPFKGRYLYVPITDYDCLPVGVLEQYSKEVAALVREGKKVAIHCMGGHGRTGYFAAAVVWLLGPEAYTKKVTYTTTKTIWGKTVAEDKVVKEVHTVEAKDPVAFIRAAYCTKAIESSNQVNSLQKLTGLDLSEHKPSKTPIVTKIAGFTGTSGGAYAGSGWTAPISSSAKGPILDDCWWCNHYQMWKEIPDCSKGWTRYKQPTLVAVEGEEPVCSDFVKYKIADC